MRWRAGRARGDREWRRAVRPASSPLRDVRLVRSVIGLLALLLGAYCLLAAATALYADTASGHPNPAELAARERYRWPGWIPIGFLALVVIYVGAVAARRVAGRPRPGPPSTQDPPPVTPSGRARPRDPASR